MSARFFLIVAGAVEFVVVVIEGTIGLSHPLKWWRFSPSVVWGGGGVILWRLAMAALIVFTIFLQDC